MSTQAEIPIACVLLAAGASKRMGRNKLELPLSSGLRMLEQTARALANVSFAERVLVTREAGKLDFDPEELGFRLLDIGQEASLGIHRSLRRGIAALSQQSAAALVALADQPFLRAEDYQREVEAYRAACGKGLNLLFPASNSQRGNPALIHREYFAEILAEPDSDRGCRYLFERHPQKVYAWQASSPAFFRDLDTPEDYRACLN